MRGFGLLIRLILGYTDLVDLQQVACFIRQKSVWNPQIPSPGCQPVADGLRIGFRGSCQPRLGP